MNHIAAAEEQIVSERLRRKLSQVNAAAQTELSGVQDHVNFTLQQAYFRCAYECFDRRRRQEDISNCVEHCSVPVVSAQQLVENEMAKFQFSNLQDLTWERLNRSLMVCQDKFEASKIQATRSDAMRDLESCVEVSIDDNINTLPPLVKRLKSSLGITGS